MNLMMTFLLSIVFFCYSISVYAESTTIKKSVESKSTNIINSKYEEIYIDEDKGLLLLLGSDDKKINFFIEKENKKYIFSCNLDEIESASDSPKNRTKLPSNMLLDASRGMFNVYRIYSHPDVSGKQILEKNDITSVILNKQCDTKIKTSRKEISLGSQVVGVNLSEYEDTVVVTYESQKESERSLSALASTEDEIEKQGSFPTLFSTWSFTIDKKTLTLRETAKMPVDVLLHNSSGVYDPVRKREVIFYIHSNEPHIFVQEFDQKKSKMFSRVGSLVGESSKKCGVKGFNKYSTSSNYITSEEGDGGIYLTLADPVCGKLGIFKYNSDYVFLDMLAETKFKEQPKKITGLVVETEYINGYIYIVITQKGLKKNSYSLYRYDIKDNKIIPLDLNEGNKIVLGDVIGVALHKTRDSLFFLEKDEGRLVEVNDFSHPKHSITRQLYQEIQRQLAKFGFFDGEIDGVLGVNTKLAIRKFKKDSGLKDNDNIDSDFLKVIKSRSVFLEKTRLKKYRRSYEDYIKFSLSQTLPKMIWVNDAEIISGVSCDPKKLVSEIYWCNSFRIADVVNRSRHLLNSAIKVKSLADSRGCVSDSSNMSKILLKPKKEKMIDLLEIIKGFKESNEFYGSVSLSEGNIFLDKKDTDQVWIYIGKFTDGVFGSSYFDLSAEILEDTEKNLISVTVSPKISLNIRESPPQKIIGNEGKLTSTVLGRKVSILQSSHDFLVTDTYRSGDRVWAKGVPKLPVEEGWSISLGSFQNEAAARSHLGIMKAMLYKYFDEAETGGDSYKLSDTLRIEEKIDGSYLVYFDNKLTGKNDFLNNRILADQINCVRKIDSDYSFGVPKIEGFKSGLMSIGE